MPSYDYRCRTCDTHVEVRRSLDESEQAVACPAGHGAARRVFTAVAVGGTSGPAAAPSGGGAGCCGGGCCG